MDDDLLNAYDLLHQIECLPDEIKSNTFVDHVETEHSMYTRMKLLIHALESLKKESVTCA